MFITLPTFENKPVNPWLFSILWADMGCCHSYCIYSTLLALVGWGLQLVTSTLEGLANGIVRTL